MLIFPGSVLFHLLRIRFLNVSPLPVHGGRTFIDAFELPGKMKRILDADFFTDFLQPHSAGLQQIGRDGITQTSEITVGRHSGFHSEFPDEGVDRQSAHFRPVRIGPASRGIVLHRFADLEDTGIHRNQVETFMKMNQNLKDQLQSMQLCQRREILLFQSLPETGKLYPQIPYIAPIERSAKLRESSERRDHCHEKTMDRQGKARASA